MPDHLTDTEKHGEIEYKSADDEIKVEKDRGHFVRAAHIALGMGQPAEKFKDVQAKALWQMAATWRNSAGTKLLATQFGLSRDSLREMLERVAEEQSKEGDLRSLEPTYDYRTGQYLSFRAWLTQLFKIWNNLPDS